MKYLSVSSHRAYSELNFCTAVFERVWNIVKCCIASIKSVGSQFELLLLLYFGILRLWLFFRKNKRRKGLFVHVFWHLLQVYISACSTELLGCLPGIACSIFFWHVAALKMMKMSCQIDHLLLFCRHKLSLIGRNESQSFLYDS